MPTNGNESVKKPASGSGEVLHQRQRLPQNPFVMAIGGFAIVAGIAYFTLYAKPKKGTSPSQIAAAAVGDESRRD